jgi:hypothetical protein
MFGYAELPESQGLACGTGAVTESHLSAAVFDKHKQLIIAVGRMLWALRSVVEHAIAVEQNSRKSD